MSRAYRRPAASAFLLAAVFISACGPKDAQRDSSRETAASDEAAPQTEAPPQPQASAPAENPTSAPLTSADIGRWEKGMEGEMQAIRQVSAKMKNAKSSEDTLNAMMGVQEMATIAAGAQAAGMEQERYKFIRSNLSAVVGYLTPSLGGIDTTGLTQAQRDELRQGNEAQLQRMEKEVPPDVVAAIRPRAVELRKKDLELVAARLKGAGMQ
jgi:hypothetical protein